MSVLQRPQSSDSEDTPLLGSSSNRITERDVAADVSERAQDGVKQAEAITLVWSKKSLVTAYVL
jgi:hypothetical protein